MDQQELMENLNGNEIAIIGLSGRFPGANDIQTFWQNLFDGVCSITLFTDEELLAAGVSPETLQDPHYVKAGGLLGGVELFDASFFGYSPREAEIIDPQQRLFLECAWTALEDAGYATETFDGSIGVYAGVANNTYLLYNIYGNAAVHEAVNGFQLLLASDKDHLATRTSYKLNLRGPSVTVQTACSTSLVAVHLACQSLLNGECDLALAGGVAVKVPQRSGYYYQEGGIFSPDGICRTFDAQARGTIVTSGLGIVVLKRLSEAIIDRDHIYAVIKGSAINNDGSSKMGYTAFSMQGQAAVVREAHSLAGVTPENISYIEVHGTGTALGDPIEIAALQEVFSASTGRTGFCAVGSVKTNIGHTDTAAGVVSLIKTALALKYGYLPATLHFDQPNPSIDFAHSSFYVNRTLKEWASNDSPRRAGVSSFGIGGTNSHVVLEEAPELPVSAAGDPDWHLLILSARTSSALETASTRLVTYLSNNPHVNLTNVAYTLQVGRNAFDYRQVLVCQHVQQAIVDLQSSNATQVLCSRSESTKRSPVFLFPSEEAHYVGMGRELYEQEPIFRAEVDRCCALLRPLLELDLQPLLYPRVTGSAEGVGHINQSQLARPALFAIEYALAKVWMHWGIQPAVLVGCGVGEYVAACLAGIFSLEDALALITVQAQFIQQNRLKLSPPQIPCLSGRNGSWLTSAQALEPNYWVQPLHQPVLYDMALQELEAKREWLFLEVGPGQSCSELARQSFPSESIFSSLAPGQDSICGLLTVLGRLWLAGHPVAWAHLYTQLPQRLSLPTYPFERERFWIEAPDLAAAPPRERKANTKRALKDWFYFPTWKLSVSPPLAANEEAINWLIFEDACDFTGRLSASLLERGDHVIYVQRGQEFTQVGEDVYTVNPQNPLDYRLLFTTLLVRDRLPTRIIHAWLLSSPESQAAQHTECISHGYYSLLYLAQAINRQHETRPLKISVITNNMQAIAGEDVLFPEKALVLGLCKVIPQEYSSIQCQSIDLVTPQSENWQQQKLMEYLVREFLVESPETVIAYRQNQRWVQSFELLNMAEKPEPPALLRPKGVYLLIGGLGEAGLLFAEYLSQTVQADLVLLGRSSFPERGSWATWLAEHDVQDEVSRKIARLRGIECNGSQLLFVQADISDAFQMEKALSTISARFNQLNGVVYAIDTSTTDLAIPVNMLNELSSEKHFQPTLHGLSVLEQVLRGKELDFCLFQSSLASVLGGPGLAAQAAASLFIDAGVQAHNRFSHVPWFVVDWEGGSCDSGGNNAVHITTAESMQAFAYLFTGHASRIVVSTRSLTERLDQWINTGAPVKSAEEKHLSRAVHLRSSVESEIVPPRNETEQRVMAIWGICLGVGQISVHDDFFDLGGDSLLAVQVLAQLHAEFSVELYLPELLKKPTIAGMTEVIEEKQAIS